MRLKYYLRGLGIGIIVTAVILMIANAGQKSSMTDDEIMERAEQLGMIRPEEDSGAEGQNDVDILNVGAGLDNEDNQNGEDDQNRDEQSDATDQGADAGQNEGPGNTPDVGAVQPPGEPVYSIIEVATGDYSDQVSQKLLNAGLIDDAEAFNSYLVDRGDDNMLVTGEHQIPMGADWEEIARLLCTKPEEE